MLSPVGTTDTERSTTFQPSLRDLARLLRHRYPATTMSTWCPRWAIINRPFRDGTACFPPMMHARPNSSTPVSLRRARIAAHWSSRHWKMSANS